VTAKEQGTTERRLSSVARLLPAATG
jgi:hypothetical protein